MARARWCGPEIYDVALRLVETCLRDGSLFSTERAIWTLDLAQALDGRVGAPIEGKGSFVETSSSTFSSSRRATRRAIPRPSSSSDPRPGGRGARGDRRGLLRARRRATATGGRARADRGRASKGRRGARALLRRLRGRHDGGAGLRRSHRPALAKAVLVEEIRVVSRAEIYPCFSLPAVRPPSGSARPAGFEPATSASGGQRSIH